MDEDPKDHDFDQRHDGPLQQRGSIQLTRRHHSDHHAPNSAARPTDPTSPPTRGRMSVDAQRSEKPQWATEDEGRSPISPPTRKSTQMSRGGNRRPSEDFDRRYDGPFGRPSLTMSRRRSSGNAMSPATGHRPSEPALPIPEDLRGSQELSDLPPPSVDTLVAEPPVFEPEPPSLNYTLHTRKWAITFFWTVVVFDSVVMPLALYYGLWYGLHVKDKMSANTVFSIVTAALGGISIGEYFLRFWRLWKKSSTCRVIGARRMYLDWFHWNFTIGWVIIMVELIVGTVPENPPIRLVAMPCPSMLYVFGTELLIIDFMRYFEMPAPCRISSIPKGAQLRPGIYSMIEDIVAVDGSGGTAYREAFNKRYEASHTFRAMLRRLGLFWSIGAQAMAILCTILVFTLQRDAAYAVGWAAPFIWAGVWTLATFWYVRKKLRDEKTAWTLEAQEKIEEGLRNAS